ncbi:MAG: DNA-protecting protein DprA, partial [Variovorax sp.]
MEREELAGWLRLTLTPGIGNGAARKLLAAFGLPADVFRQPLEALRQVVSAAGATALLTRPATLDALVEQTWTWLNSVDDTGAARRVVTLGDPGYPPSLLELSD